MTPNNKISLQYNQLHNAPWGDVYIAHRALSTSSLHGILHPTSSNRILFSIIHCFSQRNSCGIHILLNNIHELFPVPDHRLPQLFFQKKNLGQLIMLDTLPPPYVRNWMNIFLGFHTGGAIEPPCCPYM